MSAVCLTTRSSVLGNILFKYLGTLRWTNHSIGLVTITTIPETRVVNMLARYLFSIIGLCVLGSVVASPAYYPTPGACNTNNCLREFQASMILPEASSFCSRYLSTSIDPAVVTIVFKTTTTITLASSTVIGTVFTTIVTLSTAFTTTITTGLDKRAESSFPIFAQCCQASGTRGEAAEVSSACSCLLVNTPPLTSSTETSTYTVPAPTVAPVATFVPTRTVTTTVFTATSFVYVGPPPGCSAIPCPTPAPTSSPTRTVTVTVFITPSFV